VTSDNYDGLGDVTAETLTDGSHPFSETWAYDLDGRVTSFIDRASRTTLTTYDALGDVVQERVGDNAGHTLSDSWGFDELGRETQHIDNGGGNTLLADTTLTGYDNFGNVNSRTIQPPSGSATTELWTYDGAGRLLAHTDINHNLFNYSYDGAGRMTAQTVTSGA